MLRYLRYKGLAFVKRRVRRFFSVYIGSGVGPGARKSRAFYEILTESLVTIVAGRPF